MANAPSHPGMLPALTGTDVAMLRDTMRECRLGPDPEDTMPPRLRRLLAAALVALLAASTLPAPASAVPVPSPRPEPGAWTPPPPTRVLIGIEGPSVPPDVTRALAAAGISSASLGVRPTPRGRMLVVDVPRGRSTAALAARLRDLPRVRYAAEDGWVVPVETVPPNDPAWTRSSGQRYYLGSTSTYTHSVNMEPAWDRAFNGADRRLVPYRDAVTMAIVDTGVSPWLLEDSEWIVPVWDYVDGDRDTSDRTGHGTFVASILRAQTDNAFGVAGVLYDTPSRLLVYRTMGTSGGSVSDSVSAIMDAADDGAKVINCSLGDLGTVPGSEDALAWDDAVDYAWSKGAVVVSAAGNYAPAFPDVLYPAASAKAIAVGAISPSTGLRSTFSCYGPQLDVVAAGEHVWGVDRAGTLSNSDGTSFSTPLVAGSLALLWSLVPSSSPAYVSRVLTSTAVDYPISSPNGFDQYFGWGRIDVWAAYQRMIADFPEQAAVSPSATTPRGFETTLSWTPAAGSGVFYRYGVEGGPAYQTSATSTRLFLGAAGARTAWVRSYAGDRWSHEATVALPVTVDASMAPLAVERFEGADRYATAASVSRAAFPNGVPAVVVASGENWPDALCAGVLAARLGGPLLITPSRKLSLSVRDEILRLAPTRIFIVGGTPAVSTPVRDAINSLSPTDTVIRVAGTDRYETAGAVASLVAAESPGGVLPTSTALVASGETYPDALSATPLGAAAMMPVLLSRAGSLPVPTSQTLVDLGVTRTLVVGGEPALSTQVQAALPSPVRLAGPDRYATSRAVADHAWNTGALAAGDLGVATGLNFPDALSAGPLLAQRGGPIVLADSLTPGLDTWLGANAETVSRLDVFGSERAFSYALEYDACVALRKP